MEIIKSILLSIYKIICHFRTTVYLLQARIFGLKVRNKHLNLTALSFLLGPNPKQIIQDPGKSSWSDRIRIHNNDYAYSSYLFYTYHTPIIPVLIMYIMLFQEYVVNMYVTRLLLDQTLYGVAVIIWIFHKLTFSTYISRAHLATLVSVVVSLGHKSYSIFCYPRQNLFQAN